MDYNRNDSSTGGAGTMLAMFAAGLAALALLIVFVFGIIWGAKAFGRHQAIADAHNNANVARINAENEQHVNELRIAAQAQKVKITQQDAEIRRQQAIGIREAQDKISGTLTPLYVQYEAIEALKQIAADGKNATVIFMPTGTTGVPLISGVNGVPQVTLPQPGR